MTELWIALWVVCGVVAWGWVTIGWAGEVTVLDLGYLPLLALVGGISLCIVLGFVLFETKSHDLVIWRRKR